MDYIIAFVIMWAVLSVGLIIGLSFMMAAHPSKYTKAHPYKAWLDMCSKIVLFSAAVVGFVTLIVWGIRSLLGV